MNAPWEARGQAGPAPPAIVEMAASVTPYRHAADATVLDEHWDARARESAACLGGDVEGTDQVAMPLDLAVWAREPAVLGFGDSPPAGRAGRRGSMLINQPHKDSLSLGLVAEDSQQVGAAPPAQSEVLHPPRIPVGDSAKIANRQGADPSLNSEGDHPLCSFVLRLVDATTMTRFNPALPCAMASPTPRPMLPRFRGSTGRPGLPCLLVLKMQVAFGAECATGHQERGILGDDRIRMDDAEIDTGNPIEVEVMLVDRDGGGDRQPQLAAIGQQGDRSDLLRRVGERAGQPHP
jgi:hypothetical protein